MVEQKRTHDEQIRQQQENLLKKKISSYRQRLASGDDSNCGLVVEVKENVVQIQSMEGAVWIKRDQIYPSDTANCRFYNWTYQPPIGSPL